MIFELLLSGNISSFFILSENLTIIFSLAISLLSILEYILKSFVSLIYPSTLT